MAQPGSASRTSASASTAPGGTSRSGLHTSTNSEPTTGGHAPVDGGAVPEVLPGVDDLQVRDERAPRGASEPSVEPLSTTTTLGETAGRQVGHAPRQGVARLVVDDHGGMRSARPPAPPLTARSA